MKTYKIPITIPNQEHKQSLLQLKKEQNNIIRYAYNRYDEGVETKEIYALCEKLNNIKLVDSHFRNSGILKAKDIFLSTKEIEKDNIKYNKKEEDKSKHKPEIIKPIFGGKELYYKRLQGKITNEEFRSQRDMPIQCIGEANQKGNRKLEFDLPNNKLICKINKHTHIDLILPKNLKKRYKNDLEMLRWLAEHKEIPITFQVDENFIYLQIEEEDLDKYKGDKIKINKIKDYKPIKNRCLSIDNNPNYLGVSVVELQKDGSIKEIYLELIDLKELNDLNDANKAEFEHIQLAHRLYNMAVYYRCEKIGMEDSLPKTQNYNNIKAMNKTIINSWRRNMGFNKLKMLCQQNKIVEFVGVSSPYTSFLGNMIHEYHDPVNAAIEIGRRAINTNVEYSNKTNLRGKKQKKYVCDKDKFFPPINLVKDRWKKYLHGLEETWLNLYGQIVKTLELRYRVFHDLSKISFSRFKHKNSGIRIYKFIT